MRWIWAGIVVAATLHGCGQTASSAQEGEMRSPSASSSTAAGPPWYSVAGGAPTISGAVLVTSGPRGLSNGFDHQGRFQRVWSYTGSVFGASVDIDRADPEGSKREDLRFGESVARGAGHIVVRLPGIGDGGIAIAAHEQQDRQRPLVRAEAWSGNAIVSVLVRVDGAISNENDLAEHTDGLVGVLGEVLDDLRPR
jgi:hypothetical protein